MFKTCLICLSAVVVCALVTCLTLFVLVFLEKPTRVPDPWLDYRLAESVVPLRYDLTLRPFMHSGVFVGTVSMRLNLTDQSHVLVLHKHADLRVRATTASTAWGAVDVAEAFEYAPNDYWVVRLRRAVVGQLSLHIEFEGSLLGKLVGLYRGKYFDATRNQTIYFAATKFEPTYARHAFPCFDEPSMKATFDISVIHSSQFPTVLSNMPIKSVTPLEADWKKTSFHRTISMSTYLACIIVSEFEYLQKQSAGGVEIRTYARRDRLEETEFALSTAADGLDFYDVYFGIAYAQSLPKLDLVALPQFISGAMENWGVVTFRESRLLYAPSASSAAHQLSVANVVLHELAHMWFGNLVTMQWWDDLWLNEGFATFMAYTKAVPHLFPGWQSEGHFLVDRMLRVMDDDAGVTHPVVTLLAHPDDINSAFDSITYNKGCSLLRMLEQIAGEHLFRSAIKTYLNTFAYGNAATLDLWNVIEDESNGSIAIREIMASWTHKSGHPQLSWQPSSHTLTQRRFCSLANCTEHIWAVPVTYRTQSGSPATEPVVMDGQRWQVGSVANATGDWILFNLNSRGFYRMNYDNGTWRQLQRQLVADHTTFSSLERAKLLDDAFALARRSQQPVDLPMSMLAYLPNETSAVNWKTANKNVNALMALLAAADVHSYRRLRVRELPTERANVGLVQSYVLEQCEPVYDASFWNFSTEQPNEERQFQAQVVRCACYCGATECRAEATRRFTAWLSADNDSASLHADHKAVIVNVGVEETDNNGSVVLSLLRKLVTASADNSKVYMRGAASSRAHASLQMCIGRQGQKYVVNFVNRLLRIAADRSITSNQDYLYILTALGRNKRAVQMVYDHVISNWASLVGRFSLNDRYFGRLIVRITNTFHTEEQLQNILRFYEKYPEAGAGALSRRRAVAKVEANIRWLKDGLPAVRQWLDNNNYNAA